MKKKLQFICNIIIYYMEEIMNTLEKLIFCKEHGITIKYIADMADVVPSTLSQWVKGEKGISSKTKLRVDKAINALVQTLYNNIEVNIDDRDL